MRKSIVISEQDSIAALLENDRVVEFFVNRGELLLGDIYTASVENILPGIDAAFVNLGKDKMGFLHANDVPGQGPLKERLVPKQKLLVQITKEPTGHKGPRVSTAISLPGRFLVLVPEERGVSISRRISEARERARLKSVVNLLKPPGVGLIIRTEAKGQGEPELFEDFEQLWDRWQTIVSNGEASIGPSLVYRDQDLLHRVLRDAYSTDVNEVVVDSTDGQRRAMEFLSGWTGRQTQVVLHTDDAPLLASKHIDREIEAALSDRVELPSGGHLNIQPTEALTVIDVNSGRFTSSRTQAETVRRTNLEAAQEIPRQLRLRNVGGMVIVDFIDMDSRKDQQQVLEAFQRSLEDDRAKPQIGQLSDLGLVELTRRRQGQSLRELFTTHCPTCTGLGVVPTLELGTVDGKRLISTKPREDEAPTRGRQSRRGGGSKSASPLRAATITGGRVQQTLVADEASELEEVPEEILAQVPDDLLDQRAQSNFTHKAPMLDLDDEDEETDEFGVEDVSNFEPSVRTPVVETIEDGDDDVVDADDLQTAVVEAEAVRQEVEQALGGKTGETSPIAADDEYLAQVQEPEEEVAEELPEPYSPYEAEPESFSGVFRLKAKPAEPMQHQEVNPAPAEHNQTEYDAEDRFGEEFALQHMPQQPEFTAQTGEQQEQSDPWWSQQSSQQLELPLAEPESGEQREDNVEIHATAGFPGSQNFEYRSNDEE